MIMWHFVLLLGIVLSISIPACAGCCKFCHDSIGDSIEVAVSGVLTCGDCYTVNPGGGPQDVKLTFTGLNGLFTAVWNPITSLWEVVVGTVTVDFYSSSNGTCIDQFNSITGNMLLALQCSGANLFSVQITGSAGIGVTVFNTNPGTPTPFDAPLNNTLLEADCGTGNTVGGYGGTVTLSL